MDVIETALAAVVGAINGVIWNWVLVAVLPLVGLYFTVRLGAVQLRRFVQMWRVVFAGGHHDKAGISPFAALCTSLASRIGTGNLVGIALAIGIGGAGAAFWMWMMALLGMATAYAESALAQLYKVRDGEGHYRGGPAFYIWRGLGSRTWGMVFSICLVVAFGLVFNAVQANSIAGAMAAAFAVPTWATAVVLVLVAGFIIFGGLRSVARFAVMVVPFMALAYLGLAAWVVLTNLAEVPAMLSLIVRSAFGLEQAAGGVAGGLAVALLNGVKRGLFSNEAGMGSAPNIAAAATPVPHHPASQGLVQAFGVFVDTLLVCTATALMILLSGIAPDGQEGIALTQAAMAVHFGDWGGQFIAIALLFFALTSIVGNYAYAESSITFLRGGRRAFLLMRLACLAMVAWGSLTALALVWDTADAAMGLMALINLGAVLLLSGVVVKLTRDYDRQLRDGREPRLDADDYPELGERIDRGIWTREP
ncbi:MAG: alanine/glycine:cation symporter family protein [Pseudoxanthomonas suwonensis]|nr:alanine/glycine:cation symporter family protein [Pseudoxanthomonas suwonensis]